MKRSQAFPSRFLGKDDATEPFIATIANVGPEDVNCGEGGTEQKAVMTFTDKKIKPLIVNNINWMCCEAAYGEDSDDWCGQPVEIYVDPNVMFGKQRVGGVRLRIPTNAPPPRQPQTGASQRTTAATNLDVSRKAITLDEMHKRILDGYENAATVAKVEEIKAFSSAPAFAAKWNFDEHHHEEQSDARHAAMERLQPELAGVPSENDIPF